MEEVRSGMTERSNNNDGCSSLARGGRSRLVAATNVLGVQNEA